MRQPIQMPFVRNRGSSTPTHDHGPDAFDDIPERPDPRTVLERAARNAAARAVLLDTDAPIRRRAVPKEVPA